MHPTCVWRHLMAPSFGFGGHKKDTPASSQYLLTPSPLPYSLPCCNRDNSEEEITNRRDLTCPKTRKTLWGNVSYIKVDLGVALTEVLFCVLFRFVSHPDLVVLDPNFITLVIGRTLTDSYHFKQPFIVTASTVHFLFFFNISHFLAEISSRKHQNFYNEDKIKISHIRFLL